MIKKVNWYLENVNAFATANPITKNDVIANKCFKAGKKSLAKFLQANENEVLYSTGSTESLNFIANLLADQLNPGDEIIVSILEHHANIVPWQLIAQKTGAVIKVIPCDSTGQLILSEYEKLFTAKTPQQAVFYLWISVTGIISIIQKKEALLLALYGVTEEEFLSFSFKQLYLSASDD